MIVEKNNSIIGTETKDETLLETLSQACKKIAPVWPLENFVAVNPYLGLTNKSFDNVAQDLAAIGGIQMTLPTSFYLQKLDEGKLTKEDISTVLDKRKNNTVADDFINNLKGTEVKSQNISTVLTVADIATRLTNKDWSQFMINRISTWAASYFDKGQAIWSAADKHKNLFASWKAEAIIDRTPNLTGLKGFRKLMKSLPDDPLEATQLSLEKLGVPEQGIPLYLHRLLVRVGGWSAYAARHDWDQELHGQKGGVLIEFLAVLTCWEVGLLSCVKHKKIKEEWSHAATFLLAVSANKTINEDLAHKLILQQAFDLSAQRAIINDFENQKPTKNKVPSQAKAQAVFCIDVRSEVFRRNLELVDSQIETLGFAGFFAFPIKYVPIAHEEGTAQCPVLLKTGPIIIEEISNNYTHQKVVKKRILLHQAKYIWKSFKSGAVSCFSFVSPVGLSYLPKLFTDSFGFTRPVPNPKTSGLSKKSSKMRSVSITQGVHNNDLVGIAEDQQIQMAKNALTAMSLTDNFAQFVLIVGHGSTTVNNPHATGLDCGACGGQSGEANARVAAEVLNSEVVREGLIAEGITIPDNTVFLACLHDTTTDELTIFNEQDIPNSQSEELITLKKSLVMAGHTSRMERSLRMSPDGQADIDATIKARSKDWSQIRPEWGLAGCSTFVVAPRDRTKEMDFGGRSFLHSYQWEKDKEFAVLELIMTAPMVVTSWISLQYYASTVDNKNFGAGNKTLHNVTSGIGVLEGYSGDLKVGLPIQSVHDGENYQHEPLKLNVVIEAPIEAMNAVLEKHDSVRDLCDNGWIHLLALNQDGKVSHRYEGNLNWETLEHKAA